MTSTVTVSSHPGAGLKCIVRQIDKGGTPDEKIENVTVPKGNTMTFHVFAPERKVEVFEMPESEDPAAHPS